MKSIKLILLFLTVFACPSLAQEQTEDKVKDLLEENRDLSKKLDPMDSLIEQLTKEKDSLFSECEKAKQALKKELEDSKNANYKKQIKELEQENKRLRNDSTNLEKNLKDSIAAAKSALNDSIAAVKKTTDEKIAKLEKGLEEKNIECRDLIKELDSLEAFKESYLKYLAEQVDNKWLTKSYSEIDIDALGKDCAEYKKYATSDSKIQEAYDKLSQLTRECEIYKRGNDCVHSIYEGGNVQKAYNDVQSLLAGLKGEKAKEMGLLEKQLKNYKVTVRIFQEDVIPAVDEIINDMQNHTAAIKMIKKQLEKIETEDGYIKAIKDIPWLKEQYDEYLKWLSTDCTKPNTIRELIMGIKF